MVNLEYVNWGGGLVALAVGLSVMYGLRLMGAFDHPIARLYRVNLARGGYIDSRGLVERLGDRFALLNRLNHDVLDIERSLGLAGIQVSPNAWILTTLAYAVAPVVVFTFIGFVAASRGVTVPVGLSLLASIFVVVMRFMDIRSRARKRIKAVNRAVEDMLMRMAIVMSSAQFSIEVTTGVLADCLLDPSLRDLLREVYTDLERPINERRSLLGKHLLNMLNRGQRLPNTSATGELYRLIGEIYQVPALVQLGETEIKVRNLGYRATEALSSIAELTLDERLSAQRMLESRSKILIALPMATMVLPLLALILGPAVVIISTTIR